VLRIPGILPSPNSAQLSLTPKNLNLVPPGHTPDGVALMLVVDEEVVVDERMVVLEEVLEVEEVLDVDDVLDIDDVLLLVEEVLGGAVELVDTRRH
jgi:hypothetical protein